MKMFQKIHEIVHVTVHCRSRVVITARGEFKAKMPFFSKKTYYSLEECEFELTQSGLDALLRRKEAHLSKRTIRSGDTVYHVDHRYCCLSPDAPYQHYIQSMSLLYGSGCTVLTVKGFFFGSKWSKTGEDTSLREVIHTSWVLSLSIEQIDTLTEYGRLHVPPTFMYGEHESASVFAGTWIVDPQVMRDIRA